MRNTSWIAATLKSGVALSALLSSTLISSANETELDEIIVIANRTETEAGKVGSTTHVVTEEDLKNDGATFVQDYLAQLPGISLTQNGGAGTLSTLRMRGQNGRYIKVIVDGLDLTDPTRARPSTAFQHMLLADVERIEILKGSQSALYGGQAIAGVINIITKRAPAGIVEQSARVEVGSYDTKNVSYGVRGASDRADIALGIEHFRTNGFSAVSPKGKPADDDGYENTTVSAKGSFDLTENLNLYFAARGTKGTTELDASGKPNVKDDMHYRQISVKVGANYLAFEDRFYSDFSVQVTDIKREQDFADAAKEKSVFEGRRVKFDYLGEYEVNEKTKLNFGGDWSQEFSKTNDPIDDSSSIGGAFLQLMIEPLSGLNLASSVRFDQHSEFGSFVSKRLTASYEVNEDLRVRTSVGNGFRAPSLYELNHPSYGNHELEREESLSFDVGVDKKWLDGQLSTSATYFNILTDDLIDYDNSISKYNQIKGTSRSQGVELEVSYKPTDRLVLTAGYTYTYSVGPDKKRLAHVPLHDLSVAMNYGFTDDISLNVNGTYLGENLGSDWPNIVAMEDVFLLGAKASYDVTKEVELYVRGENLLDQDYELINGYQTPGLSVYAGLTASF
ncbi:Vitamin B12 transporter BtuB precursor [Pseudovibrio sp. Ad46]|uniref:TonB-dependent receptor plug domain-containing protein n=1 Tax=Pseudovibrio sp. Ad46 TaxID=989432 RepID=UPI0007AEA2AB|nr:TonB-dependent receptor [Pseudovibrio sp. Ad46]KZK85495.1 Vitamin B12 transporter BtuB precursor [Pseudovibrio sp. Ad46]